MTLEEIISHSISFLVGGGLVWGKSFISSAAKQEAIISINNIMTPTLVKIETALTGAKIEGQLAKIDDILTLEKTKAEGSNSVEFEYQKRKDDSDRLAEFGESILNSFETNRKKTLLIKEKLELNQIQGIGEILGGEKIQGSSIESRHADLEKLIMSDDHYKLMGDVIVKHIIYFKKYDENFNKIFEEWQYEMNLLNTNRIGLISNIMMCHWKNESLFSTTNKTNTEIKNLVSQYTIDNIVKSENLPKMNSQLINAFENLSEKIRCK